MANEINNKGLDSLAETLQAIDFKNLAISEYDMDYMDSFVLPYLKEYLNKNAECIKKCIRETGLDVSAITLVDYGGGQGLLSMTAKAIGIKTVIYTDIIHSSIEVVSKLKDITGIGPDMIIEGDSDVLATFCQSHDITPDIIIGMDVIEHIYDLSAFFADIMRINDHIYMLFSTASTPFNPLKKRHLHRIMTGCETGSLENPNFYTMRLNYIKMHYPGLSDEEASQWSKKTRGLIYKDIDKVISQNNQPVLSDPYNTCDPSTGNWAERILSIKEYNTLIEPYGYDITVEKGYYTTQRTNILTRLLAIGVNFIIKYSGNAGFILSPTITLLMKNRSFGKT